MAATTEMDLDLVVETDAHEGPVYVAGEDALYFTTVPRPGPAGPRVYRYDPRSGDLAVAADGFDKPNGLAFSPDERTLYVGDSGAIHGPGDYDPDRPRRVIALDVATGESRPFADGIPGFPDGLKVDGAGRVYVSCERGVRVFAVDGRLLGEIPVAGGAVNFTFGGPRRDVVLITADDAVRAAHLQATGPQ